MDLERDADLSKTQLAKVAENFINRVEDQIGRQLMIYTSSGFFGSHLPLTDWAWRQPLWVAHWTKKELPQIPKEWNKHGKTWLYWQYSAKNNGLGELYGVATKSVCLDRFNGTPAQFMRRYKLDSLPVPVDPGVAPPPPPEPPPTEIPAPQFTVLPRALHVRSGPGIHYTILRDLHAGDIITALNFSAPREAWIQIAEDHWYALAFNGYQLLRETL